MPSEIAFPERVTTVVDRVRAEFIESPGLLLTPSQAQRLFGLDAARGASILSGLCEAGIALPCLEGGIPHRIDPKGSMRLVQHQDRRAAWPATGSIRVQGSR